MGRPARISKEQILLAARRMLRDGVEGLSIRQLAAELGTVPTALYNHYESKEALINAVAEHALTDIAFNFDSSLPWHESIRQWMMKSREKSIEKPELLVLVEYAAAKPVFLLILKNMAELMQQGGIEKMESYRQAQSLLWVVSAFSLFESEYKRTQSTGKYSESYIERQFRDIAISLHADNADKLWESTVSREINGLLALANGDKS